MESTLNEQLLRLQADVIESQKAQIAWFQNEVVTQIRELRDAVRGYHPGFSAAAQALLEEGPELPQTPPKPIIGPVTWFGPAQAAPAEQPAPEAPATEPTPE